MFFLSENEFTPVQPTKALRSDGSGMSIFYPHNKKKVPKNLVSLFQTTILDLFIKCTYKIA